ncbi:probable thiopurine S-methyltransferase isoform X2 [Acropora millepora]|uniref:probable thiopurine S-methyltransferase isoform X1 n=2 Tax=Acropora TaxID=6127 RepID=UPI001CF30CA7|nr:probable thiopurine S-methyltransferase isoform X1 [Acropora millepora]XP_044183963.1 probable thiopurine S-methyltransferase isoform X2 [Acropora millepora]
MRSGVTKQNNRPYSPWGLPFKAQGKLYLARSYKSAMAMSKEQMDLKEKVAYLSTFDFESKETWEQDWTNDNPEFHTNEVNAMLMKQHQEFTGGRKNLRILVPLCGKSYDMIWLANQGHSVVGVELIRRGIELFFRDNKLKYCEKKVALNAETHGTIFKANDKDISIYECSIFDFSAKVAGGQFDCIWDRGSMTAINMMTDERVKQYRDVMLACLKPTGRYLIEFFVPDSLEGMPSSFKFISKESLTALFGERCTIGFVGREEMPSDMTSAHEQKIEDCREHAKNDPAMWMHYYFIDFK